MNKEAIICSKCDRVFYRELKRDFWFEYFNNKYPDEVGEIMESEAYKKWMGI